MSAWWGSVILAEADAQPPLDLPADLTFESLFAETDKAVDDLTVRTSASGSIACQAKRRLALGTASTSDFGKTVSQFVRQFRASNPKLDPRKDRLVLVTTSLSSTPIRTHLRAFLDRLRTSAAPQEEWTASNKGENHASAIIRSHVIKAWRVECGKSPTDAEIVELLRLVHVQTLDVDLGGDHEREAKHLLRRNVLIQPSHANSAWNTLLAEVSQYATTGQSVDRTALQRAFERDGIAFKATRSFRHDILRLRDWTNSTLMTLLEHARIKAAGTIITMQRPVAKELEAGAAGGHLLILGLPGAGKSGALYQLAQVLQSTNDVVLLAVDQIEATSLGTLRFEIGLEHDLLTVLDAWPGDGPGYVIVDALDAARSEGAINTLQSLLHAVISSKGRWHAVASVRKFDLRYNAPLRALFQGSPPSSDCIDSEFSSVRHINVPALTTGELSQVQAQSPQLGALMSGASPPLLELLCLPFNLRLLAELLGAGLTPAELQPVRTQIELLDRYWQERIRRNDGQGEARELILERVTAAMIARRSLRVTKRVALEKEAASGPYLDALLRAHVLAEWTTPSGAARPEFITFQHHLLFDYAGARLYVPPDPDDLVDLLSKQPDLLIGIRPSLELHYQWLWHHDQPSFWDLTFRLAESSVNEVGKLLGPAVAALYATEYTETRPLLDGLKNDALNAAALAVLRHVLATLLTHRTIDTPWIECLDAATTALTSPLAYGIRPYISFLSEQTGRLSTANLCRLGRSARRLLTLGLDNAEKHAWLVTGGLVAVARTITTDRAATITTLRGCISPEHLTKHGYRTLSTVARQVELLVDAAPGFVGDLYTAGFAYHDKSGEKTSMNDSQIFAMSSNRKQDYENGLYLLVRYFPRFLEQAPIVAVNAVLQIAADWARAEHPATEQPLPVRIDDIETKLVPDYSSIWGQGPGVHHSEPFQMLRSLEAYLETLTDETQIRTIVEAVAVAEPPALLWRTLLSAGTRKPTTVGRVIRSLAWDRSILTERDTTQPAGDFLTVIFSFLTPEERARVEDVILEVPRTVATERIPVANRFRDRLIGCLDEASLVTPEARAHAAELRVAGGPPPNRTEPCVRFDAVPFNEEGFLRDKGVPVDDSEHKRILSLIKPLQGFAVKFLNDGPSAECVEGMLPAIRVLESEMPAIRKLHPELAQRAALALLEAADTALRSDSYIWESEATSLFEAMLVSFVADGRPARDRKESAVRRAAAKGIIGLARINATLAEELRPTILELREDPDDEIRYELMNRLLFLFETAPALMWQLLDGLAETETKGSVLRAGVASMQRIAGIDAARISTLAERIFLRLPAADEDTKEIRLGCCSIFAGLAVHQEDATSLKVLDGMIPAPFEHSHELMHITFALGDCLNDEKKEVRGATFALFRRILNSSIEAKNALDARFAIAPERWGVADRELYGEVLQVIDEVATRVHLTSGAFNPGNTEMPPPSAVFFEHAKPLLVALASMAHPHTAHVVIETLAFFVPLDPIGILRLIAQSVKSSAAHNYQFEPLAEDLVVKTVERYLAEFRPLLREHSEGNVALMEILDIFVRVGWPRAHQLTYRLGDIYR
ncbi:MAG: hypothetical protein QM757_26335 [Paludibaculum sp.]